MPQNNELSPEDYSYFNFANNDYNDTPQSPQPVVPKGLDPKLAKGLAIAGATVAGATLAKPLITKGLGAISGSLGAKSNMMQKEYQNLSKVLKSKMGDDDIINKANKTYTKLNKRKIFTKKVPEHLAKNLETFNTRRSELVSDIGMPNLASRINKVDSRRQAVNNAVKSKGVMNMGRMAIGAGSGIAMNRQLNKPELDREEKVASIKESIFYDL